MSLGIILLIAFGGCLAFEGVVWAIFPSQMRRFYAEAFAMGDKVLHQSGLVSLVIGILIIGFAVKSIS